MPSSRVEGSVRFHDSAECQKPCRGQYVDGSRISGAGTAVWRFPRLQVVSKPSPVISDAPGNIRDITSLRNVYRTVEARDTSCSKEQRA
jgi:hypothetical protein